MMRSLRPAFVAAFATALLLTVSPAFAAGCVSFSDLEHCPLGKAGLTVLDGALQVSNAGAEGQDGVAVSLSDAQAWEASFQLSDGDNSPRVTLGALAGGEEISRAELVADADGARLSANFTGSDGPSTYSILIYNGGTLVGSQGGVDSALYLNIDEWADLMNLIYWHFYNRVADGACVWTVGSTQPLRLTLPGGVEVEGDEIHLVEEVGDGAGHYPYVAFDGITLRSSRDLQITSEEAQ